MGHIDLLTRTKQCSINQRGKCEMVLIKVVSANWFYLLLYSIALKTVSVLPFNFQPIVTFCGDNIIHWEKHFEEFQQSVKPQMQMATNISFQ